MSVDHNEFWQQLKEQHIVHGDKPKLEPDSPWYIKLLLAFSGWFGALFILLFVFTVFSSLLEHPIACLLFSAPLFVIAYVLLSKPNNEFYQHVALALSITAQGLMVFALSQWTSVQYIWLVSALLQGILVLLMPNFLHRVFSTIVASFCLSVFFTYWGMINVLPSLLIIPLVWLCSNEFRFQSKYSLVSGVIYGLTLSIIMLECAGLFSLQPQTLILGHEIKAWAISPWDSRVLYILALMFSTWQLLKVNKLPAESNLRLTIWGLVSVFAVITINAQGVGLGVIVLLAGFSRSNPRLMGLGVVALLFYCSAYYYQMQETLLVKSGILLLIAVFAWICRWQLNKTISVLREE